MKRIKEIFIFLIFSALVIGMYLCICSYKSTSAEMEKMKQKVDELSLRMDAIENLSKQNVNTSDEHTDNIKKNALNRVYNAIIDAKMNLKLVSENDYSQADILEHSLNNLYMVVEQEKPYIAQHISEQNKIIVNFQFAQFYSVNSIGKNDYRKNFLKQISDFLDTLSDYVSNEISLLTSERKTTFLQQ